MEAHEALEEHGDEAGKPVAAGHAGDAGKAGTEIGARKEQRERTAQIGFAPIVRVDAERREIELCATSEALDSHGTIFDYDASREAFTRWIGNVREMHGRTAI